MTSPWNIDDRAFAPMYDTAVIISCTRDGKEISQTVRCFVSSDVTGEPIADEMLDTDRKDLNFSFARRDWAFLKMVRRGDKVKRQGLLGEAVYTVQDVIEDDVLGIVIKGRGE